MIGFQKACMELYYPNKTLEFIPEIKFLCYNLVNILTCLKLSNIDYYHLNLRLQNC